MRELISQSEEQTRALAAELAGGLVRGSCVTLEGEVGAGKTVFARALIQALCGAQTQVNSPTFTLVQTYPAVLADGNKLTLWHYDLYRLKHPAELIELALDEALDEGIVLMEWPEIAQDMLPESRMRITIESISDMQRRIMMD